MNRQVPLVCLLGIAVCSMTSCSKEARMRMRAKRTKNPKDYYDYGDYLIRNRPRNWYQDGVEGEKYIEWAARAGYRDAMRSLGSLYAPGYRSEDQQKSLYWYTRAAEAGDRVAMTELENAYRYGRIGLQVDPAKADHWRRRFEEQGVLDEDQQLAPLKRRAEQGDVKAMEGLGLAYEIRGEAYWKDAMAWYTRSAESGNADAAMRLCQAHKEGKLGLPMDETKADQWFRVWQQSRKAQVSPRE